MTPEEIKRRRKERMDKLYRYVQQERSDLHNQAIASATVIGDRYQISLELIADIEAALMSIAAQAIGYTYES